MLLDLQINDLLRLRKPHPCGSYDWTVTRLGADIGLECKGCGRRVLRHPPHAHQETLAVILRRELARRLKTRLPKENDGKAS